MSESKRTRTRMSIQQLMAQASREFTEALLETYDVEKEDIDAFLNQPEIPEGAFPIRPLDRDVHQPFMDVCYLQCIVMDNGEVLSGELGSLGFLDRKIPLRHLFTEKM